MLGLFFLRERAASEHLTCDGKVRNGVKNIHIFYKNYSDFL